MKFSIEVYIHVAPQCSGEKRPLEPDYGVGHVLGGEALDAAGSPRPLTQAELRQKRIEAMESPSFMHVQGPNQMD